MSEPRDVETRSTLAGSKPAPRGLRRELTLLALVVGAIIFAVMWSARRAAGQDPAAVFATLPWRRRTNTTRLEARLLLPHRSCVTARSHPASFTLGAGTAGRRGFVISESDPQQTGQQPWLSRNVLALSATSLLTDVHSHTILALLPTFMSDVLGMSRGLIGLVEGLGTAAAAATQWLSGCISDRMRRRKPFAVTGYALSLAVKPLLAIAQSFGHVVFVRLADRLGKGIRTAPRDALIADSVPADRRGRAFGFHRTADTAGAIGGSLLAYLLMRALGGDYRMTFLWATVGGVLSVAAVVLFVREVVPRAVVEVGESAGAGGPLPRAFKLFLVAHSLFHLGNLSYAFLLLRAGEVGVPHVTLGLLYLVYNTAYALSAFPGGRFADLAGARAALMAGYLLFAATCLGMLHGGGPAMMWLWFAIYGMHRGFVDPARSAYSSSLVASARRGSALGLMHSLAALMSLPANLVAGLLWDQLGSTWPFAFGAAAAILAAGMLLGSANGGRSLAIQHAHRD